jgi:hypothetical protein
MADLKAKWLRPKDLQEQLGISLSRQARLRCDGVLPYYKINSFVYYDADELNQLIADAKVA